MENRLPVLWFALWELPQNCLGLVLYMLLKSLGTVHRLSIERKRLFIAAPISISLGWFIFHEEAKQGKPDRIKEHEWGHSVQSRLLGPLYLVVVGLPSVTRALYALWFRRRYRSEWPHYFDGFPEDWADRLANLR
jgi:hypothetical protein